MNASEFAFAVAEIDEAEALAKEYGFREPALVESLDAYEHALARHIAASAAKGQQ